MFHWHGALGGLAFEASLEKLCQRSLPALRSIFYKCFPCFHLFIHLGLDAAWHRTKLFFAPQLSAARDVPEYWIACPCSHRHQADLKSLHCTIFSSPVLSLDFLSSLVQMTNFSSSVGCTFLFFTLCGKILRNLPECENYTNLLVGCDQSLLKQNEMGASESRQRDNDDDNPNHCGEISHLSSPSLATLTFFKSGLKHQHQDHCQGNAWIPAKWRYNACYVLYSFVLSISRSPSCLARSLYFPVLLSPTSRLSLTVRLVSGAFYLFAAGCRLTGRRHLLCGAIKT